MFKFTAIVVLALAICVVADPIRQRPQRRRVSARQEVLPTPAPTGYPAAGVTPEIPFELPSETEAPEFVTQQPDEVYGPPEFDVQQPDEVYGPPEAEVQQPADVYGPPETENQEPESEDVPEIIEDVAEEAELETEAEEVPEDLDDVVVVEEQPARLVSKRFQQRRSIAKPARLTKAKLVKPVNFVYTSRFQTFAKK